MKQFASKGEMPVIFSSLMEARDSLVSPWHVDYSNADTADPMNEKPPAILQAGAWQNNSVTILARWTSAYDCYSDLRGDNLLDPKSKGTANLRILKELASTEMVLTRATVDDERSWDVLCPVFQKLVSLSEDIIELDMKPNTGRPETCMDTALVAPLFKVSSLSNMISFLGAFATYCIK